MKLPGTIGEGRSGQFFLCYAIKMTATRPLTHLIQGIIIEVWQSLSKSRSEKSMDHSHHDRTYKKSRFQQELEQSEIGRAHV